MAKLQLARLKELLRYCPETGFFTRVRNQGNAKAGSRAGCERESGGYRVICVDHKMHYEHRLAWFYMTGEWPKEIDHIDLNKGNNSWANLRLATRSTNMANASLRKDNTSGYKGVSYNTKDRVWQAKIQLNTKTIFIGGFVNKEDAAEAYRGRAAELFGDFARIQ